MCGIIGGIDFSGTLNRQAIDAALTRMTHRGPDADGVYEDAPVFLGHRRLSIIDLDPRANQPMRVGKLVISFNGEIYNFREVRGDLEKLGYKFRTSSDTEVVAVAFGHEGLRCLERFEGMFAFAIWDEEKKMLTLARDRFGEKPLNYYHDGGRFFFASEIPPLEMLIGREKLEIDQQAISLYFRLSYIPAPLSPYRHMRQLLPGSWLQFDLGTCTLRTEKYYTLTPRPQTIGRNEAIAELRRLLTDSVKLRLSASDVPVATFLSGGVDSSIIAALAAGATTTGIHAYSIGFPKDPAFDESPYARLVAARHPQIRHTVIDVTENNLLDFTDRTLAGLGEPYADASIIPTAFLCSHVEEKVILGGDGADELFAGYGVYAAMRASAGIPGWLRRTLHTLAPANPHAITQPTLRALALLTTHLKSTALEEYISWRSYASSSQLKALGIADTDNTEAFADHSGLATLADILALDIRSNLPNDMLKKVDLASMQHSLEVRLPYLDRQLAEFALSLPENLLIHGRERKYILREAFHPLLPEPVLTRRKQGFLLPVRQWFKNGRIREKLISMSHLQSGLDMDTIRRFSEEHAAGHVDHSTLLWSCYVYLHWRNRSQ